jgi:secondary thiamine-phosphate synthase enzyme
LSENNDTIQKEHFKIKNMDGQMKYHREVYEFRTTTQTEFIDLTDRMQSAVDASGIRTGRVCVYAQHTTMGIAINHNEPMLVQDFMRLLERIAPSDIQYSHDLFELKNNQKNDGRSNGNAHCKALFVGTQQAVPIDKGKLMLSDIQSVFAIEFDGARDRDVIFSVSGL